MGQVTFEIQNRDCVEGMRDLPPGSVDVVVTSPPYNLGIKYATYGDRRGREEYLAWCREWATEIKRVLAPSGSFFLNVGSAPSEPDAPYELRALMQQFFAVQNSIIWLKSISIDQEDGTVFSKGHFKPLSSERFLNDLYEFVFHFTHEGKTSIARKAIGVPYADKSNIARWGHTEGGDKRCRGNVWFIPYKTIQSRDKERPHPATFPPQLAEQCIRLHGAREDLVVLDPFLGLGNSARAAQTCGVGRFVGFEIDEGYFAEAKARLNDGEFSLA